MKRRLLIIILLVATSFSPILTACDRNDGPEAILPSNGDKDDNDNLENIDLMTLKLTIGNASFTATLEDNSTAQAFAAMLPMRLAMSELNGNEKYVYLDQSLPTHSTSPGTIHEGDLMLYGSSCIVLFYKTFNTSYSYTRIGRIDNPSGLAAAVGSGNVTVTFEH